MVTAAVAVVLALWTFNLIVYLVWHPYTITRKLHA
jgi:hypothetical protein